jgi:hypothetical protein
LVKGLSLFKNRLVRGAFASGRDNVTMGWEGGGKGCVMKMPSLDIGVVGSGVLRGLANVVEKHTQFCF